mmetsp:Transcript_1944/g.4280  ORF Transcript_1944/g.4280 Transcript_1944/m.4280 type:complete len:202 (+) Transcript_1944:227-832(+)
MHLRGQPGLLARRPLCGMPDRPLELLRVILLVLQVNGGLPALRLHENDVDDAAKDEHTVDDPARHEHDVQSVASQASLSDRSVDALVDLEGPMKSLVDEREEKGRHKQQGAGDDDQDSVVWDQHVPMQDVLPSRNCLRLLLGQGHHRRVLRPVLLKLRGVLADDVLNVVGGCEHAATLDRNGGCQHRAGERAPHAVVLVGI